MSGLPTVLIADDDPHIREVVRFALSRANIGCVEAADGAEALEIFERARPDLLLVDVLMPEVDGTEVCRRVRAVSSVPILFLSSKGDEVDKIVGLEIGADDYITKPFSPRELVARVRAALRRGQSPLPAERVLRHGALSLDLERHEVLWRETAISLTAVEFNLVKAMLAHPGRVFTRETLMSVAYPEPTYVSDRTIDSHVRGIREKFAAAGGAPVETVRGVGYKVGPCD